MANPEQSTPTPDPTQLTTDAINAARGEWQRDIEALKELLGQRITDEVRLLGERLEGAEKLANERDARRMDAFNAAQRAIDKAEQDVTRRLRGLNDVYQQMLPRETFDTTLVEWRTWRGEVDKTLATAAGGTEAVKGIVARWIAGAGVLLGALVLFVDRF